MAIVIPNRNHLVLLAEVEESETRCELIVLDDCGVVEGYFGRGHHYIHVMLTRTDGPAPRRILRSEADIQAAVVSLILEDVAGEASARVHAEAVVADLEQLRGALLFEGLLLPASVHPTLDGHDLAGLDHESERFRHQP